MCKRTNNERMNECWLNVPCTAKNYKINKKNFEQK